MSLLTTAQLTQALFNAADIIRSTVDASEYSNIISRVLLLKRVSDQPGILVVPEPARWSHVLEVKGSELGDALNRALAQLEYRNPDVLGGVLEGVDFARRPGREELRDLIEYFDRISLSDNDLEFRDVVGRAFDLALDWFAERSGKRGGEFFTPRSVVQLMVRLVRPEEGQEVYDPFAGSAGMLIQASEYVYDHVGATANVGLFGQEINFSTWSLGRLNLLFHGIANASVLRGDTLNQPLHTDQGRVQLFDRVITNPPFSANYKKASIDHPERMQYGWTPERGGKADLLYIQHVLATLLPDGVGAIVTPQGVLYRGGAEAEIRERIVRDGRLEAVIGIGANVFYGTAIPASILVVRGENGIPPEQRGAVLFINAEREIVTGRTVNRLEPATVEKIVEIFRSRAEIPAFSRVVSMAEMEENRFNLNIGQYIDGSPSGEQPLDVCAVLFGGVPAREVNATAARFQVFGIKISDLFENPNSDRLNFMSEGYQVTVGRIQRRAAVYEEEYMGCFDKWWNRAKIWIASSVESADSVMLRDDLMDSLCEELLPRKVLDQYQLRGAFADWWTGHRDDLRSLSLRGFQGVIDRWAAIRSRKAVHTQTQTTSELVLSALGEDLRSRVEILVSAERQALVDTFRSWGERYATSLVDLETRRKAAAARLNARLEELGYIQ
jgi:type I restriction enzyme M protein